MAAADALASGRSYLSAAGQDAGRGEGHGQRPPAVAAGPPWAAQQQPRGGATGAVAAAAVPDEDWGRAGPRDAGPSAAQPAAPQPQEGVPGVGLGGGALYAVAQRLSAEGLAGSSASLPAAMPGAHFSSPFVGTQGGSGSGQAAQRVAGVGGLRRPGSAFQRLSTPDVLFSGSRGGGAATSSSGNRPTSSGSGRSR